MGDGRGGKGSGDGVARAGRSDRERSCCACAAGPHSGNATVGALGRRRRGDGVARAGGQARCGLAIKLVPWNVEYCGLRFARDQRVARIGDSGSGAKKLQHRHAETVGSASAQGLVARFPRGLHRSSSVQHALSFLGGPMKDTLEPIVARLRQCLQRQRLRSWCKSRARAPRPHGFEQVSAVCILEFLELEAVSSVMIY